MQAVRHGIDIVEVARIEQMLDEHGGRFRDRCFTPAEQRYCEDATRQRAQRYAVRFAAKEAILKAIGTGWRDGIAWTDMEILRQPSGEPSIRVTGKVAEIAAEIGIRTWLVSLSHTSQFATASVIGCG